MKRTTINLVYCALFASLTAICSQIAIPLPADIPLNLATLAVMLAGAFLGPWYGLASQGVYLLLGAVGVPVFAMFRGGLDRLVGPTGGYLIGYLFMALTVGLITARFPKSMIAHILAMLASSAVCYLFGTAWYLVLTQSSPIAALAACVLPFLPGDLVKIVLGSLLAVKLRPVLRLQRAF